MLEGIGGKQQGGRLVQNEKMQGELKWCLDYSRTNMKICINIMKYLMTSPPP